MTKSRTALAYSIGLGLIVLVLILLQASIGPMQFRPQQGTHQQPTSGNLDQTILSPASTSINAEVNESAPTPLFPGFIWQGGDRITEQDLLDYFNANIFDRASLTGKSWWYSKTFDDKTEISVLKNSFRAHVAKLYGANPIWSPEVTWNGYTIVVTERDRGGEPGKSDNSWGYINISNGKIQVVQISESEEENISEDLNTGESNAVCPCRFSVTVFISDPTPIDDILILKTP